MTVILKDPKLEQDLPIEILHADPVQPRVHPDAELAESIKSQGILQAITVEPITIDSIPDAICEDCGRAFVELAAEGGHFLILDGERRYRGAIAAGRKTILGKVVPPSTEGSRLVRQVTSNTGKPLSPIEEAFAFKRLMEAEGWSQAELARHLGRPRSVVGDRIRLIDLDAVWLALIAEGKLQVSHGPDLHVYAAVPSKYQAEAAKKIREDADNSPDPLAVEDFKWDLQEAFRPFLRVLSDVRPQYDGAVVETSGYGGKVKYAADPDLWKPILAAKQKAARAANKSSPTHTSAPRFESLLTKAQKALKAAGYDVPARKSTGYRSEPKAGETVIIEENRWADDIDPKALLEKLDPATLTVLVGQYGSSKMVTTDAAAIAAARESYRVRVTEVSKKVLAPFRAKLSDRFIEAYGITGPGVKSLLSYLDPDRGDEWVVGLALGIDLDEDDLGQADAERLLAAIACCSANDFKIPNDWSINQKIGQSIGNPPFKVKAAAAAPASTGPKSKKQQKRDARAAGKQVGDPDRAPKNVDVGEIRAAVEAGIEEEELEAIEA